MSLKIRIAVLVVLLLSVIGVTAVSASSIMPAPQTGNTGTCIPCRNPYYGWFCVTSTTRYNPMSVVGDINYFASGCVWSYYAECDNHNCTCNPLGTSDFCTDGW